MHVNKVSHVKTISHIARELGENEDWLFDVAAEMEPEDDIGLWDRRRRRDDIHRLRDRNLGRADQTLQR
jgi:hypothetical protein